MKQRGLTISHIDVWAIEKQILSDVSAQFPEKSVTVIMGPNGSGKSTLAHVMMGNKQFQIKKSNQKDAKTGIYLDGKDITTMPTEERARFGLFLSFQTPVAIPGVSVIDLLRTAHQERVGKKRMSMEPFLTSLRRYAKTLHIQEELLTRGIHEGFSGGERKKIELLQAYILRPSFAIFDEIDTGLDVDALRTVGEGITNLRKNGTGIILITHNHKILSYVKPDSVIVMDKGRIVRTGDAGLAKAIDEKGFRKGLMINDK